MFSSGDDGVGAGDCLTNDGKNIKRFQPNFPGAFFASRISRCVVMLTGWMLLFSRIASCPFVTTVGGTIRVNPEVAVSFSGGGFSNYFTRPRYATPCAYVNADSRLAALASSPRP